MADLFDPPTKEELAKYAEPERDLFAPPSAEEIAQAQKTIDIENTGALESGSRGVAQGVSGGFVDEIVGGAKAIGDDLMSSLGFGESVPQPEVKRDEFGRVANPDELDPKLYEKYRNEYRANDVVAREANPTAFGAGEVVGGVASAFIPGLNAAGKGSKLLHAAKIGAIEGGVYGAGTSEADNVTDLAIDTAKGAGIGLAGGMIGSKAGDLVEGGVKKVGSILEKMKPADRTSKVAGNVLFDLPAEYTEALIKNPEKMKTTRHFDEIEDALVSGVEKLRSEITDADNLAWDTLSTDKTMPAVSFLSLIDDTLTEHNVIGSTFRKDKLAYSKADEITEFLDNAKIVSESDLKKIIQKIDAETDWDKMELDTANKVLQAVRGKLDNVLKNRNKAYAKEMEAVAPMVERLGQTVKDLRLKKQGSGYGATDTTVSKVKNLFDARGNAKKPHAAENLSKLDGNLLEEIKMRQILDSTEGGVANGSRNVLTGTVTGGASGGIVGAAAGAAAGYAKDKYGRKAGKEIFTKFSSQIKGADSALNNLGAKVGRMPSKYRNAMEAAARRGGNAVAVTHFLLGQSDPEYQKHLKGRDGGA